MKVGKKVGQNTYYYVAHVPLNIRIAAATAALAHNIRMGHWNVLKVGPGTFSFLDYRDFGSDPFPALVQSWTVNTEKGTCRHAKYNPDDPPILHRKELLLPENARGRDRFVKMTERCEKAGLFKDTKRIGRRRVWAKMLQRAGIPWVRS
jgi:hypothetical protein